MTDEIVKELEAVSGWFAKHGRGTNTAVVEIVERAIDFINRQKAEIADLFFKLNGVMHHVNKWLEGDELEQNEVVRAETMRKKTLRIVEQKQAEIEGYRAEHKDFVKKMSNLYKMIDMVEKRKNIIKSEAIKEFAERLKNILYPYKDVNFSAEDIQGYCYDIIEEMTEEIQNDR